MSQTLEDFFQKNPSQWRSSYPGLSLNTLLNEYEQFVGHFQNTDASNRYQEKNQTILHCFRQLLIDGVPLQYISNKAYFYNSEFYVDERVLIPRSETELLVERALKEISAIDKEEVSILEVGVGPGTIGLSLLQEIKNKKIDYTATDISRDALDVFLMNQFKLSFKIDRNHKVQTLQTDRLIGINDTYDVILSNPPYIKAQEDRSLVHHQVILHEPHVALFLKDDIYEAWFDEFFDQVHNQLNPNGFFLMEGHESHLASLMKKCEKIFNKKGQLIQDLTGRDRFLLIRK